MSPVGFNLRAWNSNNSTVRALAADQGLQDKDPETKVLGLRWNPNTDALQFQQWQPPNDAKISSQKEKFSANPPRFTTHLAS